MSNEKIFKGSEVEVCSEEEGFEGAWYRGVLEETPTKSGRKKLRIRYMTLLSDDNTSPLIETVAPKFIRPVPPEEQYSVVVLEEGTVVDADHKDGWWTGVILKKISDDDTFLVYFDSPPDIIQFHRKQLRAHLHWTGWKWVQPENKELDKSMFCSGTMVEISSCKDKTEIAWFPAMIVKEIEEDDQKKFIVKDWNQHLSCNGDVATPNTTVDLRRVRPIPPPWVGKYELLDCVEAFHGSRWCQGLVRGILSDKCFMVSLKATKEEYVFKHSDLRPLKVWKDGFWSSAPKQKPVTETPSYVLNKNSMRSSSGAKPMTSKSATKHMGRCLNLKKNGEVLTKAETVASTGGLGKERPDAVMNDKTAAVITPPVTLIAKESVSLATLSPVITARPLKQTETETEGKKSSEKTREQMRNQNCLGNDSTGQKMPEEENSEATSRKRKRKQEQHFDLNEAVLDGTCKSEINDTTKKIYNGGDVDKQQPLSTSIESLSTGSENGVCHTAPKKNHVKETPKKPMTAKKETKHMKKSLNPDDNGETFTRAPAGGSAKERAGAVMNDKTPPVIILQEPSIAATPLKQNEAKTVGKTSPIKTLEQMRNPNLGKDLTRHKLLEEKSEDKQRKIDQTHKADLNESDGTCDGSNAKINGTSKNVCNNGDVIDQTLSTWIGNISTEVSSDQSLKVMVNSATATNVEETPVKDALMDLPFTKKLPYWKICESTQGFKSVPQRPHFSPLLEAKEDIREWSAIGMMVTFYGLLEEVKDLKLDDSRIKFNNISVSLAHLEQHGFDVAAPLLRINKVLSLKVLREKKAEERKCLKNKIEEEESASRNLEVEMAKLKRRILELQRQEAVAKKTKEAAMKKIVEMRSSAEIIDNEVEDVELEFQKTLSAPW